MLKPYFETNQYHSIPKSSGVLKLLNYLNVLDIISLLFVTCMARNKNRLELFTHFASWMCQSSCQSQSAEGYQAPVIENFSQPTLQIMDGGQHFVCEMNSFEVKVHRVANVFFPLFMLFVLRFGSECIELSNVYTCIIVS